MHCHSELPQVLSLGSLFFMGFAGSLHCMGMCGPLSVLFLYPTPKPGPTLGLYQLARLSSYALVGATLNWLGLHVQNSLPALSFVWLLVALLTAYALGLKLPKFGPFQSLQNQLLRKPLFRKPWALALCLGIFTPLLPCGLLYAALAASLLAPTPAKAALSMAVFALGTIPLLVTSQLGLRQFTQYVSSKHTQIVLRGLALFSALILIWMFWGKS